MFHAFFEKPSYHDLYKMNSDKKVNYGKHLVTNYIGDVVHRKYKYTVPYLGYPPCQEVGYTFCVFITIVIWFMTEYIWNKKAQTYIAFNSNNTNITLVKPE